MSAEILSVAEMYRADSLAMAGGIAGETLMEAAGWAVAREIRRRVPPCRVAVLCGPGNNGGDGFVVARLLRHQGFRVRLALLGDVANLKGDAALMAQRWPDPVEMLAPTILDGVDLVVDALFGAGLARPLDGPAAEIITVLGRMRLPVIAVDVPSGVDGDTGAVLGVAIQAVATVTFFRKKPGHLLYPGRGLCGEVVVADIGIPPEVLTEVEPAVVENGPPVWGTRFPWPAVEGHKFQRGHVTIVGGTVLTGAARLAARAARRAGAGLVTIAAADAALAVYRMADPGNMVLPEADLAAMLADPRRNAWIMGPGAGQGEGRRAQLKAVLEVGRKCVLDADALTWFSGCKDSLRRLLSPSAVLTPHDGEFARLFGDVAGSRLERARQAASCSGAVVVLKGADTVVAHPDGRAAINANAPPWLATAGAGDVLAGIIGGLLAAGMDGFDAACAGVWMHGAAATSFGPGLIAEDIAETLPLVLHNLYQQEKAPKS